MGVTAQIFEEIGKVSASYEKLKVKFSEFYDFASKFSDRDNRGIVFEPQLEKVTST